MTLADLFIEVVILSSSGVFSPGPLTIATIVSGTKHGKYAGAHITLGHMVVELPLVVLIAIGIATLMANKFVFLIIGLAGVALFMFIGILMILDGVKGSNSFQGAVNYSHPFIIGVVFSAANINFMLWWILVGSIFLTHAMKEMGLIGIGVSYAFHIWLDLIWFLFLTYMAAKGKNILDTRGYRAFLIGMGVFIIVFGIYLLLQLLSLCI